MTSSHTKQEEDDSQSNPDPHQHMRHLVIPGQIIVSSTSNNESEGFLRGHGTYIEGIADTNNNSGQNMDSEDMDTMEDDTQSQSQQSQSQQSQQSQSQTPQRLIASVSGTIERVNKLITVHPFASMPYRGQVGDLIIGRITSVQATRWKVYLGSACREATLPLSGVNLPDGVQRIRTSQDALQMRTLFQEGDLVNAEVQTVQHNDGTLVLHTRSLRYGKLDNGCLVVVPARLIVRRKQHFITLPVSSITSNNNNNDDDVKHIVVGNEDTPNVDMILGTNGFIWIQRSTPKSWTDAFHNEDGTVLPMAETFQKLKKRHSETPVMKDERDNIARVRNSIEALKIMYCRITPDTVLEVYKASVMADIHVKDMLAPKIALQITKGTRRTK